MHSQVNDHPETPHEITLARADYPESVVRKALYWLDEECLWRLTERDDSWVVELTTAPETAAEYEAHLHRLLNDFLLRARLDASTKQLRLQIVTAALQRLASDASGA